ncbi:uncharacterized protein LOC143365718 [Halictus rubicundus]|uniref:uncharacterized protein LOC143365718 n=1 Tax=Halictus rubicundus TaxID=77578 RepID=UPI00403710FD
MDDNKSKKCFPVEDMKEWLYRTSIKCESLKCHMDYMKLRCRDMQQDILEPKNEFDDPSYRDSKLKLSDTDESETSTRMNYNCLQKSCDATHESTNGNGNLEDYNTCQSPKLGNIVPKINLQYKDRERIENKSYKERSGVEADNFTFTSHPLLQSPRIHSTPLSPICKDILYEEQTEDWHDSYQQHLSEYSAELMQNVGYSKKPFRELDLDNQDEYTHRDLPSAKHGIKLNIPGSITHGSGGKSKVYRKNEKKEKTPSSALPSKKGSVSKLDDIASLKFRKRRKKLCGSTSKSTVATRDTNFVGRKDAKRRKQKSVTSARLTSKYAQASKKVVEIYHNSAVKNGGTSVSNSKHSRINSHTTYSNKSPVGASKQQNVCTKTKCENNNYKYSYNNNEDNQPISPVKHSPSRQKTEEKPTSSHNQNCATECPIAPVYTMEKCNSNQCHQAILQAQYCNPLTTRSYEMPTLASKLKRVNRSYFSRFTIRNIPFVVGTSVNPSHNLGLNIQQVLSIMKTRQPTVNTIAPLLIRKVGATKPMSTFMGQMNDPIKLSQMNSQVINTLVHKANSFLSEPFNVFGNESISLSYGAKTLRNFNLNLNLTNANEAAVDDIIESDSFAKKKDTRSENQLNRWNTTKISQTADEAKVLKLFSSQQNVKTRTEVQDNQQVQSTMSKDNECSIDVCETQSVNCSQNAKGIREVLVNLHDQFEEMNSKYEKLQSELEKNNDKKLEEQVSSLEKELSTKEDEINTVVNLYKEVMTLKQQMKLLQEKNSYVCISSEIPIGLGQPHSPMPFMFTKSNGTILQQKLPQRRKSSIVATKEPTSLRLASLLRQIQTFQKQLRLSS